MAISTNEIVELASKHLMANVTRFALAPDRGEGMWLWDVEGKKYLDFLGGVATCALGFAPVGVLKVINEQAAKLIHISNYFYSEPMVKLAELLCEASTLDKVFFCNSGAEANEAAIKLARKYSFDKYGPGRFGIITAEGSFHGRTLGTISATGQQKVKDGFEPLLSGFTHVPYGDVEAVASAITEETCAIMLEPVLGEGGVIVPPPDYFPALAELCRKKNLLLILDEIQTGLGRTGKPFAFQHYGIKPDIISLAKALGGGVATGAILAKDEVAAYLTPGSHSTTVGGAPLAMAVGLEMASTILAPGFIENVVETGLYFKQELNAVARDLGPKLVSAVRGQGLILAMELTFPAVAVVSDMIERGFLINATAGNVLRFVPPLIVGKKEIDILIPQLSESVKAVQAIA